MNLSLSRLCAALAVAVLLPLLLGCGGDDDDTGGESTTTPTSVAVPPALEAINDALAISGFEVTSTAVGDGEVSALLVEGDENVLVFEESSIADLDADALGDLVSDSIGEGEPDQESCDKYTVVGPAGDFYDSVVDLVCG